MRIALVTEFYFPHLGGVTEHVLQAVRLPFASLDSPSHVAHRIRKAQTLTYSSNKPVALLLCRDLMWTE